MLNKYSGSRVLQDKIIPLKSDCICGKARISLLTFENFAQLAVFPQNVFINFNQFNSGQPVTLTWQKVVKQDDNVRLLFVIMFA